MDVLKAKEFLQEKEFKIDEEDIHIFFLQISAAPKAASTLSGQENDAKQTTTQTLVDASVIGKP